MNAQIRLPEHYGLEEILLNDALEALSTSSPIRGTVHRVPQSATTLNSRHDFVVDLDVDSQRFHYKVECKCNIDRKAQIDQYNLLSSEDKLHFMLVTDYLSKALATHCRNIGIQFIDTHGNAYLRAPGLYVFTVGERNDQKHRGNKAPKGLTTQAALRVVFVLLSKPELVNATFKEIAAQSNVALGSAYNVIDDLVRRGFMLANSKQSRRLLEPDRLIDEWSANFPTVLRPKLNSRRFSTQVLDWREHLDGVGSEAVLGSESAAEKMNNYIKPSSQTIYIEPSHIRNVIDFLAKKYRLRPDPEGPIEILEKFWSPAIESVPGVAPPLVVYADLLALLDSRAKETALMIKQKFIEPTIHSL